MIENRRRFIPLLVLCMLVLLGCHQSPPQKTSEPARGLKIVTSFYPIYAMVKDISGDLNDVKMIQSGEGIHEFEPSATDIAAIYDADLFVYHSRTLESWAGELATSTDTKQLTILEATEGMQLERVTGLEDLESTEGMDEKSLYDPHTWLDPEKIAEEAAIIKEKLVEMDPEHQAVYQENFDHLKKETDRLVTEYQPLFEKAEQKTFVTQHTAFSYLARRFGLTQLGIAGISPEQEPSPRQLSELEDFVRQYQIQTIFVESNASDKVAKTIAQATGVTLKTLNPLEADPDNGQSFLENVEENLRILVKELEKK